MRFTRGRVKVPLAVVRHYQGLAFTRKKDGSTKVCGVGTGKTAF